MVKREKTASCKHSEIGKSTYLLGSSMNGTYILIPTVEGIDDMSGSEYRLTCFDVSTAVLLLQQLSKYFVPRRRRSSVDSLL